CCNCSTGYLRTRHGLVFVIATPNCRNRIWCEAYEPNVPATVGSAGLAGNGPIGELSGLTSTNLDYILHDVHQLIDRFGIKHRLLVQLAHSQNLPVLIFNAPD